MPPDSVRELRKTVTEAARIGLRRVSYVNGVYPEFPTLASFIPHIREKLKYKEESMLFQAYYIMRYSDG